MNRTGAGNWRLLPWISIAVAIVAALSIGFPVYQDQAFICQHTGSRKGYRQWFFGLRTQEWYRQSHLEHFMRETYPLVVANWWTSYSGTGKNLFGKAISAGHGQPGPIIQVGQEVLDRYVDGIDEKARMELYRLFASRERDKVAAEVSRIMELETHLKSSPSPSTWPSQAQ